MQQIPGAPIPAPPRPDLAATGSGTDRSIGPDFFGTPRRRGWRLAIAASTTVLVALFTSSVLAPVLRAWETRGASREFSFMATVGGGPARWNPCQPIHYVVNLGAAPPGSLQDVQDAVLEVSAATGIAFVFDGLTDEIPGRYRAPFQPDRYGARWAPVLIGWVDPRTSSFNFEPNGRDAAGVAGPLTAPQGPDDVYVSGTVAINAADPNPPGFAAPGDQGPVVLHELSHVIGLGHVRAQGELMEPSGGGVTSFGPGDLVGLWQLGRSAGCLGTPTVPSW